MSREVLFDIVVDVLMFISIIVLRVFWDKYKKNDYKISSIIKETFLFCMCFVAIRYLRSNFEI